MTVGIRAVNVSFSQNIAGAFTGCCILEVSVRCLFAGVWHNAQISVRYGRVTLSFWNLQVHLLDYAMMRRKVCATFGESDDAQIVVR